MSITSEKPIDKIRRQASEQLDPARRAILGQFMTPSAIADFMASLFQSWPTHVRLLEPGAGVGSLIEAFVTRFLTKAHPGSRLDVRVYELEPALLKYLREHLSEVEARLKRAGFSATTAIEERDFIVEGTFALSFSGPRYTHAILNPPYKKIGASSQHRKLLRKAGIETVNLYSAFLALTVGLMEDGGEIVAIIPRSFCNGTYFRPFREWLLARVALKHIHIFGSRKRAFSDDDVLQENIIIRLVRGANQGDVTISTSNDSTFLDYTERDVPFAEIVKPIDTEKFIHIPTTSQDRPSNLFLRTLAELGLSVATGPVVDFRVRSHWLARPTPHSAPLLYAHHFKEGALQWPVDHKKPNAIRVNDETQKWLLPRGWYTITKRFSSKEERRRVVAHVVDPAQLEYEYFGFENHLNVIHAGKKGLTPEFAHGLALFLNSTVLDLHFRTFSGHTQVNATDLRSMRFPSADMLIKFGKWVRSHPRPNQQEIDAFIESQNDSH